jgi:hypothetical protein
MPIIKHLSVKGLVLDLSNYRTVPQKAEIEAVIAMITVRPDQFWALMHSLLDDGYHPTDSIIILKTALKGVERPVVKEGNRRIGALKIAHGYIKSPRINIPSDVEARIEKLTSEWKQANITVPCTIYEPTEASTVDKIVAMTHGKAQLAGRDMWRAVARARHNRDKNGASEPGLDVLEKFLAKTSDLSATQVNQWGGDYPVTVLDEALKNLASRCGFESAKAMASKYPHIDKYRQPLDKVIKQIGFGLLGFAEVRSETEDFATPFGFPSKPVPQTPKQEGGNDGEKSKPSRRKPKTPPLDDVKAVRKMLRSLSPTGMNSAKVVTLLNEIATINISTHPHAFCFVLRSIFEISAKAYCGIHGLKTRKENGDDLELKQLLLNVTNQLTNKMKDRSKMRELHGALNELREGAGVLSVTSMNQLVHNKTFSVKDTHICAVFSNIFPLLEAMNT